MLDKKTIGERLRELRISQKKTREEVCARTGVSYSAISMYEAGERIPRDEIKVAFAREYGMSIEEIFFSASTRIVNK